MKLWIAVAAVLWITGCGKNKATPPTVGADACAAAIAHAQTLMELPVDMTPEVATNVKRQIEAGNKAMIASCQHDAWPPHVTACIKAAKTREDLGSCNAQLSADQKQAAQSAVTAATRAMGPAAPASPAPSASGSAAEAVSPGASTK